MMDAALLLGAFVLGLVIGALAGAAWVYDTAYAAGRRDERNHQVDLVEANQLTEWRGQGLI